ncbi:recombinase family protein [Desulfobacter sp. UBA2225]|uniref:recombinase family protein n=1 Tax=Desulfobacter sp. UBA2225 TaxID=1961413 RepID=UPI002579AE02|nr:recombinase family protein [Desulfobacter sp. UBA2225]
MIKAFGYVRVSGKSQINGDGFKRQEKAIKEYAKASGYQIERIFKEEAISGTLDETERPAFQEMVSAILKNGVRTIIIEGMDRLARDLQIQTALITYLASKEITLISARTDQDITKAVMEDPMQKALVQIQGVFSELEKNLLVKKLKQARTRKKEDHGKCEGRKSYQELNPELIAEIKRLRRKPKNGKRLSLQKTMESLNESGFTTTSGKPFTLTTLKNVIYKSMG